MKKSKSIIAVITAVAIFFSVFVVADASAGSDLIRDSASVDAWNTYFSNNWILGSGTIEIGGIQIDLNAAKRKCWSLFDESFADVGVGAVSSYKDLSQRATYWTARHKHHDTTLFNSGYRICFGRPQPSAAIRFDSSLGVYRLYDEYSGAWLVNSMGYFPYYEPPKDEDGNVPAEGEDITGIQWLPYEDAFLTQTNRHFVTKSVLDDMAAYYEGIVLPHDKYYVITTTNPVSGGYLYLCDPHGYPFVNVIDPDSTAVDTPNNYYTDEDKTTTNFDQLINIEDGVVWFPTGEMQWIDNLYYDESTHTYHVDSHDQYIINSFNNTCYTYNYTWEYNYYIDYTSITYVGQTEEYEDPYICYYELPDGRSSADLTAEELEQLSMAFVDIINYARSADDLNQRVLYHFDGNTEDSSYWSYCTAFDWIEGASLTYMDEGTFNGSLYLDETAHEFEITLPNVDTAGDFTFQFRYYQSYTAAPANDASITFGDVTFWSCNGEFFFDKDGVSLGEVPIGSWNEIALVRDSGFLFYYLNGVCTGSVQMSGSFGSTITFYFGSEQQTYKKLDEMRFTRAALYSGGADYTPTSVPYDTNLTLVLPDGEIPLADEYYTVIGSDRNLIDLDFSDPSSWVVTDARAGLASLKMPVGSDQVFINKFNSFYKQFGLYVFSDQVHIDTEIDGLSVSVDDPSEQLTGFDIPLYFSGSACDGEGVFSNFPASLSICLSIPGYMADFDSGHLYHVGYSPGNGYKTYTFTVVDTAGNTSTITFQGTYGSGLNFMLLSRECTTFDLLLPGSLVDSSRNPVSDGSYRAVPSFFDAWSRGLDIYGPVLLQIIPNSGSADIAYIELVEGDTPDFKLEYHTAVYSSGQLEDSPVLAVRSTTKVTGWQIGGVRPSYPQKGQVWALVENSRITSLQQYSGYAWLAVDGRIWTGSRWIPTGSLDVFTLQDYWDMQGTTPKDDYTYIYTESGFWDWWQKQWLSFTGTLWDKMDDTGGGDSLPDLEDDPLINEDDKQKFDQNEYTGMVRLLRQAYGFVSEFFSEFTMGGIQGFLKDLSNSSSPIYGLFWMNGL